MVGELKRNKKINQQIGNFLQNFGKFNSDLFSNNTVKTIFGNVGKVVGKAVIPIPGVGGTVGKIVGESIPNKISYASGLIGEVGGAIKGEKSMKDILTYIPNRMINDTSNSNLVQVITGQKNWRDAVMQKLEKEAMVDWFSDKTYAWEKDGKFYKEWVDGANPFPVVGEWKSNVPEGYKNIKPELNSNSGILGVYNGEILRKGFDDDRYQQLKQQGKL